MKNAFFTLAALASFTTLATADIYPVAPEPIEADLASKGNHFMTLGCSEGSGYTFTLNTKPGTGYVWQQDEQREGVKVTITPVEQKGGTKGKVGAPGKVQVTIIGLKPGDASFTLSYVRPWEKEKKAARTLFITLCVDPLEE